MAWSNWRQAIIWINFDPVLQTTICLLEKDSYVTWTRYWRIINEVLWHSSEGYFIRSVQVSNHWNAFENSTWICFMVHVIFSTFSNKSTACFPLKVAVARFHYLINTWNKGHVTDIVYHVYAQYRISCFMPIIAYNVYARYYTFYMLYIAYHVLWHIIMTRNYISNIRLNIGSNCKLRSHVSGFDLICNKSPHLVFCGFCLVISKCSTHSLTHSVHF